MTESSYKTHYSLYVIICILPFLVLYWLMPFVSDITLGRDYPRFTIHEQKELLFSIKTGSFPLYVPGYHMGQSSSALTMGQIFHPLSYIVLCIPGYWNGNSLQWYTLIKLLSLGITQIALFGLLRQLKINTFFSFLLSFITVYNLRMLDLFRFGASLEAYNGYLLLCTAISWHFIRSKSLWGSLGIIVSAYMLVVSGHPQHMYYGLLGTGLFLIAAPFFLSTMLNQRAAFNGVFPFWLRSSFFILTGIALASVYTLPFYFDFLSSNVGRVHQTYDWSIANIGVFEMLGNFFMPYFSDVHGAFGGSSLFILVLLMPLLKVFKIKIPRPIWGVWGILSFVILYNLGDITPVYKWAWKYFPFISSVRHQGRSSIIIPVFLLMILSWLIKTDPLSFKFKGVTLNVTPYSVLAFIAALLIPVYIGIYVLFKPYHGEMPPITINDIPRWTILLMICAGALSLIALVLFGAGKASRTLKAVLVLTTIIQISMLFRYGTFIEPLRNQTSFEQMLSQKREKLAYRALEVAGMESSVVTTQVNNSFMEPFLGKIYSDIIPVDSQDDAYHRMRINRLPQQLFIEGYDIKKARELTAGARSMRKGTATLTYSSFNRLQFKVYSQAKTFFGLSYPYTGHWNAWVNGKKVPLYRANGSSHAVEIPAGESVVEFRYWSNAFFWGLIISCATFTVIGIVICLYYLRGFSRLSGAILIVAAGCGGFILVYGSLYSGANLETDYTWGYSRPLDIPNLAYGKKTVSLLRPWPEAAILHYHSSHTVDGDKKPEIVFPFKLLTDSDLILDLNQQHKIRSIVMYGELTALPEIFISQDKSLWDNVTSFISSDNENSSLSITFEKLHAARFIKVRAIESSIPIYELEVYGERNRN